MRKTDLISGARKMKDRMKNTLLKIKAEDNDKLKPKFQRMTDKEFLEWFDRQSKQEETQQKHKKEV